MPIFRGRASKAFKAVSSFKLMPSLKEAASSGVIQLRSVKNSLIDNTSKAAHWSCEQSKATFLKLEGAVAQAENVYNGNIRLRMMIHAGGGVVYMISYWFRSINMKKEEEYKKRIAMKFSEMEVGIRKSVSVDDFEEQMSQSQVVAKITDAHHKHTCDIEKLKTADKKLAIGVEDLGVRIAKTNAIADKNTFDIEELKNEDQNLAKDVDRLHRKVDNLGRAFFVRPFTSPSTPGQRAAEFMREMRFQQMQFNSRRSGLGFAW